MPQENNIWPSANKDSYCWGQDIPNNIFKSIEYIRLSSCIFKMIGPEENLLTLNIRSMRPSQAFWVTGEKGIDFRGTGKQRQYWGTWNIKQIFDFWGTGEQADLF